MGKNLKKIIPVLVFSILLTSCASTVERFLFTTLGPPSGHVITGGVNPLYGYEAFEWGTSYEYIDEKTGWNLSSILGDGVCCIGSENTSPLQPKYSFYPHGSKDFYVDETLLYFDNNRLYAAQDGYKKRQTLESLHGRYGAFSEENLVTHEDIVNGIEAIYRGQNYLDIENFYALEIVIYTNGKTYVKLKDPFFEKNKKERDNNENTWLCYGDFDNNTKRINFTFLNKNGDGKYLFVGYSKGYEKSNISYVRAGVCWGNSIDGSYDIKGSDIDLSNNYSSEKWFCEYTNETYVYTNNETDSARKILELFLTSENVAVRHNKTISYFSSAENELLDKMVAYGITWEEIDAALVNEEF